MWCFSANIKTNSLLPLPHRITTSLQTHSTKSDGCNTSSVMIIIFYNYDIWYNTLKCIIMYVCTQKLLGIVLHYISCIPISFRRLTVQFRATAASQVPSKQLSLISSYRRVSALYSGCLCNCSMNSESEKYQQKC